MATSVEAVTTLLTVGGLVYMLLALWGARDFKRYCRRVAAAMAAGSGYAPDVSILKPLKGVDARMYAGFVSHCAQQYAGKFEILFGVSSMDDRRRTRRLSGLRMAEFPCCAIRLIECPERLGASGKVSNLIQMLRQARYDYILINDSDIRVSPNYLARVMACFGAATAQRIRSVGMVTVPYLGRTAAEGKGLTLWARLEALGIATDFLPGVLTARKIEGGIRFGLGSTLAVSRDGADRGRRSRAAGGFPGRRLRDRRTHRARRLPHRALRRDAWRRPCRRMTFAASGTTSCAGRVRRATRAAGDTSVWALPTAFPGRC